MSLESQTILLAISAAFVSAATNITFAPALRQMGSFALAQFNNLGNTLMLGVVGYWMYEPGSFRWEAFAWFGVLGVMNYSINRWVFYTGMNIVGPARHITITSMVPLPSLFLAVIFLGEEPGLWVLFGTLLVVLGIAAVSYEPSGGRWFRVGIGWSLMSMLMLVGSAFMRKQGMSYMAAPALLTAWSAMVAIPTSEGLRHFLPKRYFQWGSKRYLPLLVFGTIINGLMQILINLSLKGKLSLAVPILSSTPIFALCLSALFLRDIERLNA
ncbi:MAG: DMT family transporter, partial [Nitrospinae bacterium]|nr:DMT family transporter [Nitrospinota bacterium]